MIPEYWIHEGLQTPSLLKHTFYSLKGDRVQILSLGTWSPLEGPDFQNALLLINGTRIRGDIEIHRTLTEWFHHGHHLDNRYTNVVLHILLRKPTSIPATVQHLCHVLFPQMITRPFSHWVYHMGHKYQGNALPSKSLQPLPNLHQLWQLSRQRFLRKARRIAEWRHQFTPEDMIFLGIAEALGFPSNRQPLLQILWQYPPSQWPRLPLKPGNPLNAFLFLYYISGFSVPRALFPHLEPWKSAGIFPVLSLTQWRFAGIRPGNQPIARLIGLATLIANAHRRPQGLFHTLREVIQQRWPLPRWKMQWQHYLQIPIPPSLRQWVTAFWPSIIPPHNTMGEQRFHEVVINVLLPVFYWWAVQNHSPGFAEYVWDLYEQYPQPLSTRVLQRVWQRLHQNHPARAQFLKQSAGLQQGIYEWLAQNTASASDVKII